MNRDEFMELVYETFTDEPDNVLANGIIEVADAYVEHEKAQLSQEGTTSDTISRQAAIDAAKEAVIADEQPYVENALKSVSPVRQENGTGEWVTYYKYDIFIGRYEWKRCSKCSKDMISHETDYCPHCGAKMTISTK